jgi:hypothetical protein
VNPVAFVMSSLAADEHLDPTFRRAFAPTVHLDRFLPPADLGCEFDGPDPDDVLQRECDNELEGL